MYDIDAIFEPNLSPEAEKICCMDIDEICNNINKSRDDKNESEDVL